ncbi:MAG: TIGR04282 family arsenosugar biosynthesis glycosyltransferase [Acidimicrobiia bacterium]
MHLTVVAKAPVPGRVKTRLVPPYSPAEAAALAEAALADTLARARASRADEVVVALDGAPGDWLPPGCTVVPQGAGTLGQRLAAAWRAAGGPGLQIGMDTPQVATSDLDAALAALDDHDAALGLAEDGGWWAIGLRCPDDRVFEGIETSRADTGRRQAERLASLGLRVAPLPVLRDVDVAADVDAVAALAPGSRFALTARALSPGSLTSRALTSRALNAGALRSRAAAGAARAVDAPG